MGLVNFVKKLFKKEKLKIKTSFKIQHNQEIDPILILKNDVGLTPGEIILLDWSDNKFKNRALPKYFKYKYDLDKKKSIDKLINKGYLSYPYVLG